MKIDIKLYILYTVDAVGGVDVQLVTWSWEELQAEYTRMAIELLEEDCLPDDYDAGDFNQIVEDMDDYHSHQPDVGDLSWLEIELPTLPVELGGVNREKRILEAL